MDDDAISRRVRAALEAAGDVAYLWDLEDDRIEWSGRFAGIALDPAVDLKTGRDLAGRIYADDLPRRRSRLAEHCSDGSGFVCEYRLRDGAGRVVWVEERGSVNRDSQGQPRSMLGVVRLRGEPGEDGNGEAAAGFDALTGHFVRTRLRTAVDRIIGGNERANVPSAFLAVAVDSLSTVPRSVADSLLIEVARRLDRCLRVSDVIGRLGEDRFGIMLAYCPAGQIAAAARRIAGAVAAAPIETTEGRVAATVSIGAVACRKRDLAAEDVILRAETALDEARRQGCGGCVRFRPNRQQREEHRRSVAAHTFVREALQQDRLLFAFQPVVCAATGRIDYFECLLRLRGPDGQITTGGDLVKSSERLGLVGLIDHFALDQAVSELRAHPEVRLGLNVSGLTVGDRRWLRALTAVLRDRPDWARRLVIEITETATLDDLEESARFVNALRHAGCSVALDDFGAGHTSLQHLQGLAIDTVKIDGSLVRNLSAKPDNQVFIRHLLGLAKGFGFATLAECVETAEDAAILRSEGVGFLQGYHIGRPTTERCWLAAAAE